MLKLLKKIGAFIAKEIASLQSVEKKLLPIIESAVTVFINIESNTIVDDIEKAVSGGLITDAIIFETITIAKLILEGLVKLEGTESMTTNELFIYLGQQFQTLNATQKTINTVGLSTNLGLSFVNSEKLSNAQMTTLLQGLYSQAKN